MSAQGVTAATPLVSVVIAAYERSATLAVALASVREQTVRDLEVLVVGDATTDDSEAVVDGMGDPRLRFANLPCHTGHQAGPNTHALTLARARWIAYLGQDDLWLPRHLEWLLEAATRRRAELAVAGVFVAPPRESEEGPRVPGLCPWGEARPDEHVPPSGWLHTRRLGEAIGGWRLPEKCVVPPDVDFLQRARAAGAPPVTSGRVSVVKLSAAQRPGSYRLPGAAEQEAWLERIRGNPELAHDLAIDALRALQRALPERHVVDLAGLEAASAADWNRHWRAVRGVDPAAPTPRLEEERSEGRAPRLVATSGVPATVEAATWFTVRVRVENRTRFRLASEPPHPVHLASRWSPAHGGDLLEGSRTQLLPPLAPGKLGDYVLRVLAPPAAGRWQLRAALVQELVTWFDADDECFTTTVDVVESWPGEAE